MIYVFLGILILNMIIVVYTLLAIFDGRVDRFCFAMKSQDKPLQISIRLEDLV